MLVLRKFMARNYVEIERTGYGSQGTLPRPLNPPAGGITPLEVAMADGLNRKTAKARTRIGHYLAPLRFWKRL